MKPDEGKKLHQEVEDEIDNKMKTGFSLNEELLK